MQYKVVSIYTYFSKFFTANFSFIFLQLLKYNNMSPAISVIMAAYNVEKYISESIESVLNQTFSDFELIIINDGSTDNTLSLIEYFQKKDPRIKVINNNKNQFVIKSRNIGLEKATGKYITILDSDDLLMPEKFEKQFNFLEENTEVFLIGTSVTMIDENNNYIKDCIASTDYLQIKTEMLKHNTFYHSSIMFRNSHILFREKMLFSEDYDLLLNIISQDKIVTNLPEKLVQYRVIQTSLSRKSNKLIQWLFKNKTLEFYHQRLLTGDDSYNSFDPEELLQIENINYGTNKKDLLLAIKGSFYENNFNLFRSIIKKYKKYYSLSISSFFYSFISIHSSIFKISQKLYSKL